MADPDGLELKPWQQTSGESNQAYHGFVHFLSLQPFERTMAAAYTSHLRTCKGQVHTKLVHCIPIWNEWRFRYSWLERAAAQDTELAERDRLRRIHEIDLMNHRHTQISVALQNLVVERLQGMVKDDIAVAKLTPVQMATLLDRASLVERRSRGEATSIIRHEGGEESTVALDLSKLTDQELEVFQHLVAKAEPGAKVEVP